MNFVYNLMLLKLDEKLPKLNHNPGNYPYLGVRFGDILNSPLQAKRPPCPVLGAPTSVYAPRAAAAEVNLLIPTN